MKRQHRLSSELRSLPSGVEKTAYHEAKGIEPLAGVPVRNGDLLVPVYDVEGKLLDDPVQSKRTGQNGLRANPGYVHGFTNRSEKMCPESQSKKARLSL